MWNQLPSPNMTVSKYHIYLLKRLSSRLISILSKIIICLFLLVWVFFLLLLCIKCSTNACFQEYPAHTNTGSHIHTWKLPSTITVLSTEQPYGSKWGLSALLKGTPVGVSLPQSNLSCLSKDRPGNLPVKSSLL